MQEMSARAAEDANVKVWITYIHCTAFLVPSRVIHIIRCSQHPESFVFNLGRGLTAFMSRTYSRAVLCSSCMKSSNRPPRSAQHWDSRCSQMNVFELHLFQKSRPFFLREKNYHWSPRNGTCFFHLTCYQVAPICHELDLELVGKMLLVEQLLLLVVH